MNIFSFLFDKLRHDAAPLLKAAAEWAEEEGLSLARDVEAELRDKLPTDLIPLFNEFVGPQLGFALPAGAAVTAFGLALLKREMAKSLTSKSTDLRASVLNAGVEQAALLLKGEQGDAEPTTNPQPTAVVTK